MYAIIVTICGFFILLGFEIRYRLMTEEMAKLTEWMGAIEDDISKLKAGLKLKQDAYEEFRGPQKP